MMYTGLTTPLGTDQLSFTFRSIKAIFPLKSASQLRFAYLFLPLCHHCSLEPLYCSMTNTPPNMLPKPTVNLPCFLRGLVHQWQHRHICHRGYLPWGGPPLLPAAPYSCHLIPFRWEPVPDHQLSIYGLCASNDTLWKYAAKNTLLEFLFIFSFCFCNHVVWLVF